MRSALLREVTPGNRGTGCKVSYFSYSTSNPNAIKVLKLGCSYPRYCNVARHCQVSKAKKCKGEDDDREKR
jgi:hypothetical protein